MNRATPEQYAGHHAAYARAGRCAGPSALDEAESKEVLRAYGIATHRAKRWSPLRRAAVTAARTHRLPGRAQGGVG